MVPKQTPIRAKDLVAKNLSPRVKAIYDRALKNAYRYNAVRGCTIFDRFFLI